VLSIAPPISIVINTIRFITVCLCCLEKGCCSRNFINSDDALVYGASDDALHGDGIRDGVQHVHDDADVAVLEVTEDEENRVRDE
jgi:hypothetical protein